jgi:hypothetical protein
MCVFILPRMQRTEEGIKPKRKRKKEEESERKNLKSGSNWLALLVRIQRSRVEISARRSAVLTEIFLCFSQSFQENVGIVPYLRN